MITNVSKVARTYRTHDEWYEEEDAWQRSEKQSGFYPGFSSGRVPAKKVIERYAFGSFARTIALGLAEVLKNASRLKDASASMQAGSGNSALDIRTVVSTQPEAVSGIAGLAASIQSYTIESQKIATAQINLGTPLPKTSATLMTPGSNQMKLSMGGECAPFSVYILQTDTNALALQKIREAIRHTGFNIDAVLAENEEQSTVRLQLSSKNTGAAQAFAVSGVYGNAADVSGINTITQPAQDAVYRINDELPITSDSNEVKLDNGSVTVLLKNSSAEPIQLSVGLDMDSILQQEQSINDRYNLLLAALMHSSLLLKEGTIRAVTGRLSRLPLDELGIRRNAGGTLHLDPALMKKQAEADFVRFEHHLCGADGLVTVFIEAAEYLLSQPTDQLLNRHQRLFQSFTNYRFQAWSGNPVGTYLPLPLTGTLLNNYL